MRKKTNFTTSIVVGVGCRFKSNYQLVGCEIIDGMPSVGVFLPLSRKCEIDQTKYLEKYTLDRKNITHSMFFKKLSADTNIDDFPAPLEGWMGVTLKFQSERCILLRIIGIVFSRPKFS